MPEHYHHHHHHVLMVEEAGQNGMEEAVHDAHVRVVVEVGHSYWEEGVGLHDCVGVEEVGLVRYDDHHEREGVEVPFAFQLQVVDWPSQFHHASLQSRR